MIVSTFKSVQKAYVDLHLDMPWEEIAELMMHHNDVEQKNHVELYNMVEFKDPNDETTEWGRKYHYINGERQETYDLIPYTTRRCKNNVVSLSGIVLDIDEHRTIDETMELLHGLEYVLYTTFRNMLKYDENEPKQKFRVVIPFSRPLLKEDIEGRQQSIIDTLPNVDNCSFTVSQSFYFHSGKHQQFAHWNRGIMIDPYDFQYTPPIVYVPQPIKTSTEFTDDIQQLYKDAVIKSLLTCSGLHYAGVGANNLGVLTLVSICRSIGLTFEEYDMICSNISDNGSELKKPSVRRMAWTGWDGDKIRKETRDKFIESYGGIKVVVQKNIPNSIFRKEKII
jgi:hypothetical protein